MIISRLILLSLETIEYAQNAHQQIIKGETAHRPLRGALTATEITGQYHINVPV